MIFKNLLGLACMTPCNDLCLIIFAQSHAHVPLPVSQSLAHLDISKILALISHSIASKLTWLGESCDFSRQTLGVNFTNLCGPIEKTMAHSVRQKIWCSISPTIYSDEICPISIFSMFESIHFIYSVFKIPSF